jgi:regulator of protease activity HflC (stomatin/prohibitin superfamily)
MAETTATTALDAGADATPAAAVAAETQLTQVRVPLRDAAQALSTPDASGRPPIVVLPQQAFRIRNELVTAGIVVLLAGLIFDVSIALRAGGVGVGVALVILGVFQAFIVPIPEGSQAILLRRGRFHATLRPGNHFVPPWIIVSHLVTTRETPFTATASEVPTRDDVRTNLVMLLTFRVAAPERFVFTITVPDFDHVCQASCQDAVRLLVRSKTSEEVLDLGDADGERLRQDIGTDLEPYGVEVARVVVTDVRPPTEFVASRESRRLAGVQRAEEQELHELELLRLADRDEQERQRIRLHRAAIELEAENEVVRLERLDSRIREYPTAMQWDTESRRLDVAAALASNTRAMVQVGPGIDVATSILMQTPPAGDGQPDSKDGQPVQSDQASSRQRGRE